MEKDINYKRDIWIVSSDAQRADLIKTLIPDESYRFAVFSTNDGALAKMESINYRREKKPDLVITDENLNRIKDMTKEKGSGKVVADAAMSCKIPAIILQQNAELSSPDFVDKFKDNVTKALASNRFSGLLARKSAAVVNR